MLTFPVMSAVDYSFSRPSIAALIAAGVKVVLRYVGPPEWGKTITQPEYDALVAAGITVLLVFEIGTNDSDGGFNAGTANAHTALQYVPTGYTGPIFFAADESLNGPGLDTAVEYIRGACGAMGGAARTGVYGEGALLTACLDAGWAAWFWQSASTSYPGNATTLPFVQIQQGLGGVLPGTDADTIHALVAVPIAPAPVPPQEVAPMLPSNCTDVGAIDCQIRVWWATFRSDSLTAANQGIFRFFYLLAPTQMMWGVQGYGSNPDTLLAGILDDASKKGLLRPQFAGAV